MIPEVVRRRLGIQVLISFSSTSLLMWVIWTFVFPFPQLNATYVLIILVTTAVSSFVTSLLTIKVVIALALRKSLQVMWISGLCGVFLTLITFLLARQWHLPHNPQSLVYRGFPLAYWGSLFWYPSFNGMPGEWLFGIYLFSFLLDFLFWMVFSLMISSGFYYFKRQFLEVVAVTLLSSFAITLLTEAHHTGVYGYLLSPVAIAHGFPWAFFQIGIDSWANTRVLWYGLLSDILFWFILSYPFVVAALLSVEKRYNRRKRPSAVLDAND